MTRVERDLGAGLVLSVPGDGEDGEPEGPSRPARVSRPWLGHNVAHWMRTGVDSVVVAACTVFVLMQLGPSNLVADTTPAGGDMGAHVWGPAFLRDVLLPNFELTGWSADWYAGFAAYQFYMVIPSLLIVVLDVGLVSVSSTPGVLLAAFGAAWLGASVGLWPDRRWRYTAVGVGVAVILLLDIPYGVAFKLVAVSGALSLPPAAYAFGRLARLPFPGPALLAVGTLPFLFYRGYSIYGGNLASTLAGEFAFSISLSLALLYLGVVIRGLETGRHRGLAAVLLALCGLCHIIPAFWVLAATAVLVLLRPRRSSLGGDGPAMVATGSVSGLIGLALSPRRVRSPEALAAPLMAVGAGLVVVGLWQWWVWALALGGVAVLGGAWLWSQSTRWLLPVMVVGGLLAAFWLLPFVLRADMVNDMGWEKLPTEADGGFADRWGQHLLPGVESEGEPQDDLRWAFVLAAVGLVLSLAMRVRLGVFLAVMVAVGGVAFALVPEGRLWNGRILPFYYLAAILLAMLAVALSIRLVARWFRQQRAVVELVGAVAAFAVVLLMVALPLGVVWLSDPVRDSAETEATGYRWPAFSPIQVESSPVSFIPGWADWNFSGYEGKDAWPEYAAVVQAMDELGQERGCGRAMWEYESELDRYGTPMALMLLPYWTDGCIGSMEGLFFESSMTTPFHFLMQTELSEAPSSAQRNMPYSGFDMGLGIQHLQLMGVRYYMATSEQAIEAARNQPALTEVARSGPWEVFEVADSELVVPLAYEPAVLEGVGHGAADWVEEPRAWAATAEQGQRMTPGSDGHGEPGPWPLAPGGWAEQPADAEAESEGRYFGPGVQWFLNPEAWEVPLAVDGPSDWQRIELSDEPTLQPVSPAEVTDVVAERDRLSFRVDEPGSPVLVKVSYFPNWEVSGGEGPWRVAPNLMVVLPTDEEVELTYGATPVEGMGHALTAAGILGVVLLFRRGRYRFQAGAAGPGGWGGWAGPPGDGARRSGR